MEQDSNPRKVGSFLWPGYSLINKGQIIINEKGLQEIIYNIKNLPSLEIKIISTFTPESESNIIKIYFFSKHEEVKKLFETKKNISNYLKMTPLKDIIKTMAEDYQSN